MHFSNRLAFAGMAGVALGLLSSGLVLGELFRLQPCYWCNFQRLLYMLLMAFCLCGAFWPGLRRFWSLLAACSALAGVAAAGRQSWMQYAPQEAMECGFGDPTLSERLIDWLGGLWPSMFMVTGLCKEKDWVFLGLSLANWSAVCFLGLFCAALWLFFRQEPRR